MRYLLLVFIFFVMIYQSTSFIHYTALLDIIQFSVRLGIVGKVDIFATFVIMLILYFETSVLLFSARKCYSVVLDDQNFARSMLIINLIYFFLQLNFLFNLRQNIFLEWTVAEELCQKQSI